MIFSPNDAHLSQNKASYCGGGNQMLVVREGDPTDLSNRHLWIVSLCLDRADPPKSCSEVRVKIVQALIILIIWRSWSELLWHQPRLDSSEQSGIKSIPTSSFCFAAEASIGTSRSERNLADNLPSFPPPLCHWLQAPDKFGPTPDE